MNTITDKTFKPIENSYLKLLFEESNPFSVLTSINLDTITDDHTRIICRTIIGSLETLLEYIDSTS